MLTLPQLKKHIKKCKRKGIKFGFLGLVENKDLTPEVESLFVYQGIGMSGYDWVNGNNRLKELISDVQN